MLVEPDPVDGPGQRAAVLPISSGNSPRTGGLAVLLKGAGTKATGVARRDQPRALDVGCRHKPPRSRFAAPSWAPGLRPVSYTHLDVYKRQDIFAADVGRCAERTDQVVVDFPGILSFIVF